MEQGATLHAEHQLKYRGAVDADGHILEPVDLWERYIDPQYRDRALRFIRDDKGLEALSYDGKPSAMSRSGPITRRPTNSSSRSMTPTHSSQTFT